MLRRLLLTIVFTFILAACGQTADLDDSLEDIANAEENEQQSEDEESENEEEASELQTKNDESNHSSNSTETNDESNLTDLTVHTIDAGQADATLFEYTNSDTTYTVLYDTGDWNKNDVVNYLKEQNITHLDLVIVSHPHADHIGQMAHIIESFTVEEVWFSGNTASSKTFQQAAEAVLESDATYYEPRTGDIFDIGSMTLEVLHPSHLTGGLNEDSISVRFTYGDIAFLLTGDAYKDGELEMIEQSSGIKADILQLGHHGSNTSSDPDFIDAVNPEIAIYSAGEDNSYEHPHDEVVSLIQDKNIDLYGTDVHGTIIITTDGNTYDISTKQDGTITPESTDTPNQSQEDESNNEPNEESSSNSPSTSNLECININNASHEEIQNIKHIGPARADDLLDLRPFESINDLERIDGIGPARIEEIKEEGIACVGGG